MRVGSCGITGILLLVLPLSTPAFGTEWDVRWDETNRVCSVAPAGYGMVLSMRQGDSQRQARIHVAGRLEEGGVVYLRVDEGRQHTSKQNFFEGGEAQVILNEIWAGEVVEVGSSTGVRPIRIHDRLTTAGFQVAVGSCMRKLGWNSSPETGEPQPDDEQFANTPRPTSKTLQAAADLPQAIDSAKDVPAASECDIADRLRELAELRSEGLLTDEEFDDIKERLLARCRAELGSAADSDATSEPPPSEDSTDQPSEPAEDTSSRFEASALDRSNALGSLMSMGGAPAPIDYEIRWANGTAFVVGSAPDLHVWVAFSAGRDPQALVYVVNATSRRITFAPESIRATAVRSTREGLSRAPVSAFSATEYEKKVRTKQAWQAALHGAATAMANQPQPQRGSVSGSYSSHRTYTPGSQLHGSFYGQITRWPTATDYAAAQERTTAQIQAMGNQLQASFDAMSATLMRTHTLEPGTYYGGVVHFARFRGKRIDLEIPYGEYVFRAEFTLP